MAIDDQIVRVLRLYPEDCQPRAVQKFDSPESFSGAKLWQVQTDRGLLCLRKWPAQQISVQKLEFIQAVLWHVNQEGFHGVPLPVETQRKHGYVWHASHLWEIAPWLPGTADYALRPSRARLAGALRTLAEFHQAAASFPLPESDSTCSPGIQERGTRLAALLAGGLQSLRSSLRDDHWPQLAAGARRVLSLVEQTGPRVVSQLKGLEVSVPVQPCIRDIWSAHVLYLGEEVSGLVDFGAMRPDNVATDIARLLGSMTADDPTGWRHGLASYQTRRRLSDVELKLVEAFHASSVVLSPVQWLEWIYLEGKEFPLPQAVLTRYNQLLAGLEAFAAVPPQDMLG